MNLDPTIGPTPLPDAGQWVRFSLEGRVRDGRVTLSKWPSLVVRFLGDAVETVFPWAFDYYPPREHFWGFEGFQAIAEPQGAAEMEARVDAGMMGVREVAAALGVSQKAVRNLLRSGKLEGHQESGKWTLVTTESVEARRRGN